jgi:RNA polymerase sigma-54 factor
MEILNMTALELSTYLENLALENPVVDLEEPDAKDNIAKWRQKLEWLDSSDRRVAQPYHEAETQEQFISSYGRADSFEDNLYLSLLSQLHFLDLEPQLRSVAAYVIESLDPNGYLDESDETIAAALHEPLSLVEEARRVVQSLDRPAWARAQSARMSHAPAAALRRRLSLALTIAEQYLDDLGKNHLGLIAKSLNLPLDCVRAAAEQIRVLQPRPGMSFSAREKPAYIIPDLVVHFTGLKPEVIPNDNSFPSLKISGFYRTLFKNTEDDEVKFYLRNKLKQATWVMQSIEKRKSTLLRCTECIMELQSDFFLKGHGHLVPMVLSDVAHRLNVHVSTVSRAIRGKHIQCDFGTFPLTYFFSRGLGGQDSEANTASPDFAKALLKRLIQEEDKKHPCSDQKLSELMGAEGVRLSRRTVAKYRDELGFPNAFSRGGE